MKRRIIYSIIVSIFVLGCTNPVQTQETESKQPLVLAEEVPKQPLVLAEPVQVEPVVSDVYIEPEYEYTIIGTWERAFDGHLETYVFTEDNLDTYCCDNWNGTYDIEYMEDWTFMLGETIFDYELLHTDGVQDALVLCGYVYRREEWILE